MRVSVLMGGRSAEREVSLKTGGAVAGALRELGHEVTEVDADGSLCESLAAPRPDVAFVALHGGQGEDGCVQGLLEVLGLPYTGSGVLASAMAMDKLISKVMFGAAALSVPPYVVVTRADWRPAEGSCIGYPLVVKPSREGSSVGVAIVRDDSGLGDALDKALSYEGPALVEAYVKGREIQVGVLGDRALGAVEVRPADEFYSYEAKYASSQTQYILPPELPSDLYERAMDSALRAHKALGCAGATRVDLIVTDKGEIFVLEVNTIPGMTQTSLLPKIASLQGMDFNALVGSILDEAVAKAGDS